MARKIKPLIDEEGEVRELTKADFDRMRPAKEVLPPKLYERLIGQKLKCKNVKSEAGSPPSRG